MINKNDLIKFEEEIAAIYQTGVIKGPIHLRDGNEDILIDIFKDIKVTDYKFTTWSNHLESLLSGVPKENVKQRILDGKSMANNWPEYRFYSSAIVGGICSIATGVALGIKKREGKERVWAFIGDMCFSGGQAHECIKYSIYNNLPITWIVADNNKSVDTPTNKSWGPKADTKYLVNLVKFYNTESEQLNGRNIIRYYKFNSKWPHSGTGAFISF